MQVGGTRSNGFYVTSIICSSLHLLLFVAQSQCGVATALCEYHSIVKLIEGIKLCELACYLQLSNAKSFKYEHTCMQCSTLTCNFEIVHIDKMHKT